MITPEQVKLMTQMADPKRLASLKANGLPTIDLDKVKAMAAKQLELQAISMATSLSTAIGSLQASADRFIQEKMDEIEKLGKMASKMVNSAPSSIAGAGSQTLNMLQMEMEKLKQAKAHGAATGNYVPLLALMNSGVSLKHLSKDTVVLPKIELPALPKVPGIG